MKTDGKVTISTELDNNGIAKSLRTISGSFGGLKSVLGKLSASIKSAFPEEKIARFGKTAMDVVRKVGSALKLAGLSGGVLLAKGFETTTGVIGRMVGAFGKGSGALSQFGGRMREILSGALLFNGIRKAVSAVTEDFGTALAQCDSFRQGMANLKGAAAVAAAPLVQALAPALGAVANAAALALNYVAKLVAFFTGGSVKGFAAAAKSMNAFAGGAAKAKRSLAGFDEITRMDDKADSGGGSLGDITANFDFAGTSPFLDTVKNSIQNGDWAGVGGIFAAKMNELLTGWNAAEWGAKAGTVLQHGIDAAGTFVQQADWQLLGQRVAECFNGLAGQIDPAMLGQLFAARITAALLTMGGFFESLDWAQLGSSFSAMAAGFILALAGAIAAVDWGAVGRSLAACIAAIDYAGLAAALGTLFGAALRGALDFFGGLLGNAFTWLQETFLAGWNEALDHPELYGSAGAQIIGGLFQGILSVISGVGSWLWDNVASPLINAFCEAFGIHSPSTVAYGWGENIIQGMFNALSDKWQSIPQLFTSGVEQLKTLWRNGCTSLKNSAANMGANIRTTVQTMLSNVVSLIRSRAAGIRDSFTGAFRGAINSVIGLVNNFINWLNSALSFSWDGLVIKGQQIIPGGSIQLANLPTIPYLAQGAVIPPNREFLAVLGDQPHGTNIEAPLATIQQAVADVMQSMISANQASHQTIIAVLREILEAVLGIQIGDDVIARAVSRYQAKMAVVKGG